LNRNFDMLVKSLAEVSKSLEKLASFFETSRAELQKEKVDKYIG